MPGSVRASTVRKQGGRIRSIELRLAEAEEAIGLLQKLIGVRGIISVPPPATPEAYEMAEIIESRGA